MEATRETVPERRDNLMQSGLNLIQQALSIYDGRLKLAVCNSRFAEMFALPDRLIKPGADFDATIRYLAERGDYGEVDDIDVFVREKVEQALAFEPHYVERRRSNGQTISIEGSPLRQGGWVTVYTDISAIKRQEELLRSHSAQLSDQLLTHSEEIAGTNRELASTIAALEQVKRELTESEALTRSTTEMMPAHIAHLDLRERYTYSNRKLPSVIPGRPTDIVGKSARAALGDEAYFAIRPYLEKAFRAEPSVFEFTHSNGGRRIRCAFTPENDEAGHVNGVYILSMDVTEEAMARAALVQSHKRELAAQLTSGLAHDFANLLTIILGLQGRMLKLDSLPERARELAHTTRAAALRGGVLLDRLSNISGQRELQPLATDLPALLADIRAMATPSLPENVTLSCDCGKLEQPLMLDSGFLQDSLLNLVLNARDAIGVAGGAISISLAPVGSTWLEIEVADTGPGFSREALDHALDPFYTSKRNDEGSGLGLTMVYDFAQMSGGLVKIGNRPGGGAIVTMRLPLKHAESRVKPRLILLVEDTPEIRKDVREMLRGLGHSVLEAASAEEAEVLADIPGVDTVLTDITLDGPLTGTDLANGLAARQSPPRLFLMTSLPASNARRKEAQSRFPVIGKPFTQSELSHFLDKEPQG